MERVPVKKIILTTIAVAGVLSVAVLAPNVLQVIKQFSGREGYRKKKYLNNSVGRLLKKGYVKFEVNDNGKKFLRLTQKGEKEVLKYQLGDLEIKRPKKWDKK